MNEQADLARMRGRNLRMLAGLAALFFMPLLVSFWIYYGTSWRPAGRVNHGALIDPARPLPSVNLPRIVLAPPTGREPAEPQSALFHHKWTLVYVGDGGCNAACRRTLYVMRQTRLALGTDMGRVTRVFLVTSGCCAKDYLAHEHAGIAVLDATGTQGRRLLAAFPAADQAYSLYIVDPLGNLMMRYDVRRDPRGLLVDLKRLLKLSQIG